MFLTFLLLCIVLPVVELALLIKIGRTIDIGPTVALVVLTGVIGAALAKHQGLRTLARIQEHLARGTIPAKEMVDGLLILIAGAVLITPGVITDAFGFVLLIPPTRALVRRAVTNYFKKRTTIVPPSLSSPPSGGDEFIDVEAYDVPESPQDKPADERR